MADRRLDAGFRERGLDSAQRSAAAHGNGCAVLLEECGGRPRQPVADDAQSRQVDAEALIADHADVVGERDAGLVDGEGMPRRTGTQAGIGERVGPADRHRLGLGEPGGVHDGADDGVDALGLELGDRRGGKRCGCHGSHSAARRDPVQGPRGGGRLAIRGWARSACRLGRYPGSAEPVPCRPTVRTREPGRQATPRRSARCTGSRSLHRRAARCARWRTGARTRRPAAPVRYTPARCAIPWACS